MMWNYQIWQDLVILQSENDSKHVIWALAVLYYQIPNIFPQIVVKQKQIEMRKTVWPPKSKYASNAIV